MSRIFASTMYRQLGLLDGVRVVRSSDVAFRRAACDISEFFVDVPYEGEIVRARCLDGTLEIARRRRYVRDPAASRFHQGTNQSQPAIHGCVGCNPFCIARITLPVRANKPIFARRIRPKLIL